MCGDIWQYSRCGSRIGRGRAAGLADVWGRAVQQMWRLCGEWQHSRRVADVCGGNAQGCREGTTDGVPEPPAICSLPTV